MGVLARVARCSRACCGCPGAVVAKLTDLASHGPDPGEPLARRGPPHLLGCGLNPSEPLARRGPPHLLGCGLNSGELLARHGSDPGELLARRGPPHLLGCGLDSFLFVPDRHE